MDDAGIEALREAIRHTHGCDSTWVRSVPVRETFRSLPVWEGEVQVFDLAGHPSASRCYAWAHATSRGGRRFYAVLHVPPVDSAVAAVRASIVADARAQQKR